MAFLNAQLRLQTIMAPIYTCPAGQEAVVHSILVTPLVLSSTVSLQLKNAALETAFIGKDMPLIEGGSLYFPKPLNLAAGEAIEASCLANDDVDVVVSVLQQAVA